MIIFNGKIETYKEFLDYLFEKNIYVVKIMNLIINISLLITFYIMISGFGAYFEQEFKIDNMVGALILGAVCFLVFMTSVKGVARVNSIVVPMLIIFIIVIGFNNLIDGEFNFFETGYSPRGFKWLWATIIYCSYNMILLIPVLVNLKEYIKSKKQILIISIISGIIMFLLAMSIYFLLARIDVNVDNIQMPAVYVIGKYFVRFKRIYGVVILLSIFSTAISVGISFLENTVKNKRYFPQIAGIMCITSCIISNFGFSNLVKLLFPIIGYMGVLQILLIIKIDKNAI